MSLDEKTVAGIAHLARIAIDEQELAGLGADLSRILDLVAQMDAVDTADVEPTAHPLHMRQRLRPDEVTETNQRERFQAIAPAVQNGLYLVPRVVE